jgi:hypothetical protein
MSAGALDLFISLIAEVDRAAMKAQAPQFQQEAPFFSFLFFHIAVPMEDEPGVVRVAACRVVGV